ncbi:MAG: tetratricopeptide repeat protein [Flavobacterium sp.]|uniref:sensor histidine kinase n=1 Tax=Flavobacterium sp. TaxID=239 RepID=UPI001206F3F4|nr:histidine kinase dimerization/phosphoacceptor domain -containing protein [Flavobacterium sp.]RZJ66001.1 MAG: tetratricopeptide repeat protein [Flavobacterium sp.]
MKKLYFVILLSVSSLSAQTKQLDSLNALYEKEKKPSRRFDLLTQLNDKSAETDLTLAATYARKGVDLAKKTIDKEWLPKFHERLGRNYANMLELDSAWVNFERAMKGYVAVGDKKGQATTYFKMGWVLKKRGEFEHALQADLKALKLMESIDDKAGIAGATTRVAEDLARQERLEESLRYAKRNIDFCKKNDLPTELMFAYVAAGDASIHANKVNDSYFYFKSSLDLAKTLGVGKMTLADLTNNVGNALKRQRKYKEALATYEQARKYATESNYGVALGVVAANLGEVNMLIGNYKEALPYQLQTIKYQEENHDVSNLTENYGHISTTYEKLGDYPKALEYHKKSFAMRDSIAKADSDKAMSEMLTKYETEKKEATIKTQNRQIANQRLVQWLSAGFVVLLLAFLAFGLRSYRARTQANKLLATKNAENELLMKEIHHRVKNNLELVKSLIALQSAHLEDSETKTAMLESQNRVQSMGIIHQKLYQGENLGSIEMKDYFMNLGEGILDTFNADDKVRIECAMENLELDIDTAVPIGLIVNELLTNSLKYAFPQNAEGKITISLSRTNPKELTLKVSDDGIGKTANSAAKGTGFGTQLVHLLTIQLNGIMEEHLQNGTETVFRFKLKAAA